MKQLLTLCVLLASTSAMAAVDNTTSDKPTPPPAAVPTLTPLSPKAPAVAKPAAAPTPVTPAPVTPAPVTPAPVMPAPSVPVTTTPAAPPPHHTDDGKKHHHDRNPAVDPNCASPITDTNGLLVACTPNTINAGTSGNIFSGGYVVFPPGTAYQQNGQSTVCYGSLVLDTHAVPHL